MTDVNASARYARVRGIYKHLGSSQETDNRSGGIATSNKRAQIESSGMLPFPITATLNLSFLPPQSSTRLHTPLCHLRSSEQKSLGPRLRRTTSASEAFCFDRTCTYQLRLANVFASEQVQVTPPRKEGLVQWHWQRVDAGGDGGDVSCTVKCTCQTKLSCLFLAQPSTSTAPSRLDACMIVYTMSCHLHGVAACASSVYCLVWPMHDVLVISADAPFFFQANVVPSTFEESSLVVMYFFAVLAQFLRKWDR